MRHLCCKIKASVYFGKNFNFPIDKVGKQCYDSTNLIDGQNEREENKVMKKFYSAINMMMEMCMDMCMWTCYMCKTFCVPESDMFSILESKSCTE